MTGVYLYRDGLPFDPPLTSCAGCTSAEDKIRALLDKITNSFLNNPAKFIGLDSTKLESANCSELFHIWVQKSDSEAATNSKLQMCPDLKKRIEALVCKLLNERYGLKRKRDILHDMLASLKCAAMNPFDQMEAYREDWLDGALKARNALLRSKVATSNSGGFPSLKKQKTHKFLRATNSMVGSHNLVNEPTRRSRRTLLKIGGNELSRKRIPIGDFFQADVLDWVVPPYKKDSIDGTSELNDSKWLGTNLWPIEGVNRHLSGEAIGKGRSHSCACSSRGSLECVRFHVNEARLHLKSVLGSAFFSLGFVDMGEEVSKSWTQEEQMRFDDLVRQNPSSEGKSFWEHAVKSFTSKSRQDIVSFYFNVFVLRWMSIRTRLGDWTGDSSDDENLGWS